MTNIDESILITVSGPDRPGITATLTRIIVKDEYRILDIGQSVTHGLLSLSILISSNSKKENSDSPILKEMLFAMKKLGLTLEFEIVETEKVNNIFGEKFILSCVAPKKIPPLFVAEMAEMLSQQDFNILRIDNVSTRYIFQSLEVTTVVPYEIDYEAAKSEFLSLSKLHGVDVAFLREDIYRKSKRLIVFDMDSTLIQTEVIDEMAKAMGPKVEQEVKDVTERAMNGELDFTESLRARVSKLKGLKKEQMDKILAELPLTPGVEDFIRTVKNHGYKLALISGGFNYFAQALKEKLGLDYAFANDLEFSHQNELTGNVIGTVVDATQKAVLVDLLAQQNKISVDQVVAIGDGANDLQMLAKAGLGIAFHAKDIVREKASNHMSYGPMTTILHFLGIKK